VHRNTFFDAIENQLIATLFEELGDRRPNLTFIEVGAFDGKTNSHVHRLATTRRWQGIVIEPAPSAFRALEQTYRAFPRIKAVNCAIADRDGALPFYWVRNRNPESWEGVLSSLDKETILRQRNLVPDVEEFVVETRVPVHTLARICLEHDLKSVDLLKVDAEGRDDQVIHSIDFDRTRPTLILYKHRLISQERNFAVDEKLTSLDYKRLPMWANTIYVTDDFGREECVHRVLLHAASIFPPGRDPEWGNGNWYGTGPPTVGRRLLRRLNDFVHDPLAWSARPPEGTTASDSSGSTFIATLDDASQAEVMEEEENAGDPVEIARLLGKLTPVSAIGVNKARYGGSNDGGYVMLDDLADIDVCYSLGIGGDVSWDGVMASRGIDIFQYDHTVDEPPENHPRFHFFKFRISANSRSDLSRSLSDLVTTNGHAAKNRMILKMDIEGDEWAVLAATDTATLSQFRQIVVELHGLSYLGDREWRGAFEAAINRVTLTHVPIHIHGNNYSWFATVGGFPVPDVVEVTFARRDSYAFGENLTPFPTSLDRPCRPNRADLSLGRFEFDCGEQ
jgi:FkbM family methyltransferase